MSGRYETQVTSRKGILRRAVTSQTALNEPRIDGERITLRDSWAGLTQVNRHDPLATGRALVAALY
jgi:hypothetical protein